MTIRPERSSDVAAIRQVIELAFGRSEEANLVEALRNVPGFDPTLALVAEIDNQIVGHIMFSPIIIQSQATAWPALALAPVCVHPQHQNRGVGSGLILHGLHECKMHGHGIVVVLGEPGYYARFGFQRASQFGVRPPFEVPGDAFMVVELTVDALREIRGMVCYSWPFGNL